MRWIVITLLVAACAAPTAEVTTTSSPPISTTSLTIQPSAEEEPRLPAFGTAAAGARGVTLERISPHTLRRLPDTLPIDLGQDPGWAMAPDGRTLAVGVRAEGEEEVRLSLIDLELWSITHTKVRGSLSWLQFGADGRLYWMDSTQTRISRLDPSTGDVHEVGVVPGSIDWLSQMHILPSSTVVIYSIPNDADGSPTGPPVLHFLEGDGSSSRLAITGVDYRSQTILAPDGTELTRDVWPTFAWDLERGLLYVVHAEEETITVVDLEQRTIARQTNQSPGFLERLASWLIPVAEAKGPSPGVSRQAILSPDGARLYVTGSRANVVETADGWGVSQSPLGISVFDTATLEEVGRSELPIDSIAFSPDGSLLLGTGSTEEQLHDGTYEFDHSGIFVLDAASLRQEHHLDDAAWQWVWVRGFSSSGRYAYLSMSGAIESLMAIDLHSGELVADRLGSFWGLFPESGILMVWEDFCPDCNNDGPWPFRLPEGYGPHGKIEEERPPAE